MSPRGLQFPTCRRQVIADQRVNGAGKVFRFGRGRDAAQNAFAFNRRKVGYAERDHAGGTSGNARFQSDLVERDVLHGPLLSSLGRLECVFPAVLQLFQGGQSGGLCFAQGAGNVLKVFRAFGERLQSGIPRCALRGSMCGRHVALQRSVHERGDMFGQCFLGRLLCGCDGVILCLLQLGRHAG